MALEQHIYAQWQTKWQPTQNGAKSIISTLMGPDWLSVHDDYTASMATTSAVAPVEEPILQVIELDIGEDCKE